VRNETHPPQLAAASRSLRSGTDIGTRLLEAKMCQFVNYALRSASITFRLAALPMTLGFWTIVLLPFLSFTTTSTLTILQSLSTSTCRILFCVVALMKSTAIKVFTSRTLRLQSYVDPFAGMRKETAGHHRHNKIDKMKRAAREAALALMTGAELTDDDRTEFGKAISEAFGHINDQTFRSRMDDLLTDARRTIPSLGAAFNDWPDAVSTARNNMAHQPWLPDNEDDDQFIDLLIALSYSIAWVLRTNLLNKAGFDADAMQEGYRDSSSYGHHLANTRMLLAGGPWAAEADLAVTQ
jgi:hypothetical protein